MGQLEQNNTRPKPAFDLYTHHFWSVLFIVYHIISLSYSFYYFLEKDVNLGKRVE